MRQSVMNRIAEELQRYKVVASGAVYVIWDSKEADYLRDASGDRLWFRNKGRAQRHIDRLEVKG